MNYTDHGGAGSYILKCLLSPDVRQLATTSSDKTIKLWNLDGFSLDRTLTGEALWRSEPYETQARTQYCYCTDGKQAMIQYYSFIWDGHPGCVTWTIFIMCNDSKAGMKVLPRAMYSIRRQCTAARALPPPLCAGTVTLQQ